MTPTADTSVRVGWADDAAGIAAVQVAAWRASYTGLLPTPVLEALGTETVASSWHSSLTNPRDARNRVLVALERNRIVGFSVTVPCTDADADQVADGEISDLTVLPEERGKGHGSRLLQACVDTLVADRFTRAVMWLHAGDDQLRSFLNAAGWAPDTAYRELDLHGDGQVTVKQIRMHTAIA